MGSLAKAVSSTQKMVPIWLEFLVCAIREIESGFGTFAGPVTVARFKCIGWLSEHFLLARDIKKALLQHAKENAPKKSRSERKNLSIPYPLRISAHAVSSRDPGPTRMAWLIDSFVSSSCRVSMRSPNSLSSYTRNRRGNVALP